MDWEIAVIFILFWGPVFGSYLYKCRQAKKNAIKSDTWTENTGSRPALFNVDVVYKNGKSAWAVSAKSIEWDLYSDNPVLKFRKKQDISQT